MIEVRRYSPQDASLWDAFVNESHNGTFLHLRPYMDYHADRFEDFSLIAEDEHGRWIAVLPACRQGDVLSSHAGLTFAGWIMGRRADSLSMLAVMDAAVEFLADKGFKSLIYKTVPYIYTTYPSQDDLYALWRHGAQVERMLISSVVDLTEPIPFDTTFRRYVRRAQDAGITFSDSDEFFEPFWILLTDHLRRRFGVNPVHTFEEISLLHSRFPDRICLYTAWLGDELLGGEVYYHARTAAHCQYVALSDAGRDRRVLPALHKFAMDRAAAMGERYFDFGTSNEDGGRILNPGLARQKNASGGRGVAYVTYSLPIR